MTTKNSSVWYEGRRNELLGLLAEATALDLPEKYAEELRTTARKCQEDAFEIALVGEFQGGKSTTFNALCDGRDLSPRGLGGGGIKTSAAVISAQNIAGDETENGLPEWAEVEFKTPQAIALGLSGILRRPLSESDAFRRLHADLPDETYAEMLASDEGFPSLVDLGNAECRAILLAAVDGLWQEWEKSKTSFSDDDLDQLRIATLQLRFFGTDEYKRMAAETVLPIHEFQKLVAFPKDWMIRWTAGARSAFALEEVSFVFVHSVLVRIHAENLRRLGCRITDCPGLFANAYDTAVARRTIKNADAVWYLLNGDKQIGQTDMEIIRVIASMGMLGKIEATCNLKGAHEQKMAEIIPSTKAALANAGLAVAIYPYNARLAFLAAQGNLLLASRDLFSRRDLDCMKVDAKVKEGDPSPESMWAKMVRRAGIATELESLEDIGELDADAVAAVRRESMLDGILSRLENDIIPQKSRSILVDRGSDRAAKALAAYEGVLKASEDAAAATEAEWRAKVDASRQQLADFVGRAKTIIDRSAFADSKDVLAGNMARDIIDTALDDEFVERLSVDVAAVLRTTGREFYLTRKAMEKAVVEQLTPIMADDFRDSLTRAIEVWEANAGTNSLHRLHRAIDNVCADIHDLWEDRQLDGNDMLKGFSTPSVSPDDIADVCGNLSAKIMDNANIGALAEKGRRGIFAVLWAVTWPFLLGMIGGMICLPLTIVAIAGKTFWDLTRSAEERERAEIERIQKGIGRIVGKIRPDIARAVSDTAFRANIERPLADELAASIQTVEDILRRRLDDLKVDFERERVAGTEEMFGQSVEERKRIAGRNRDIRTKTIEPLRKRIDAFREAVSKELASA